MSKITAQAAAAYEHALSTVYGASLGLWEGPAVSSAKIADAVGLTDGMDTASIRAHAARASGKSRPDHVGNRWSAALVQELGNVAGGFLADALVGFVDEWITHHDHAEQTAESGCRLADALDTIDHDADHFISLLLDVLLQIVAALSATLRLFNPTVNYAAFRALLEIIGRLIDMAAAQILGVCEERDATVNTCLSTYATECESLCAVPRPQAKSACSDQSTQGGGGSTGDSPQNAPSESLKSAESAIDAEKYGHTESAAASVGDEVGSREHAYNTNYGGEENSTSPHVQQSAVTGESTCSAHTTQAAPRESQDSRSGQRCSHTNDGQKKHDESHVEEKKNIEADEVCSSSKDVPNAAEKSENDEDVVVEEVVEEEVVEEIVEESPEEPSSESSDTAELSDGAAENTDTPPIENIVSGLAALIGVGIGVAGIGYVADFLLKNIGLVHLPTITLPTLPDLLSPMAHTPAAPAPDAGPIEPAPPAPAPPQPASIPPAPAVSEPVVSETPAMPSAPLPPSGTEHGVCLPEGTIQNNASVRKAGQW